MQLDDSPHTDRELLAASRRWLLNNSELSQTAMSPSTSAHQEIENGWSEVVSLGWASLRLPEALGGMQGNFAQLCSLIEATGEALSPVPLLEHSLAVELLNACPLSSSRDTALVHASKGQLAFGGEQLLAGELPLLMPADAELDRWTLRGQLRLNFEPAHMESLLLRVRDGRLAHQPDTLLILLPKELALSKQRSAGRRLDGRPLTELMLDGMLVSSSALIAQGTFAQWAMKRALDTGRLMLCAEACGIARRVLKLTVEHLQTRRQFGQPLGKFQILQHRAADMLIGATYARDLTWDTIVQVDAHEAGTPQHLPWPSEMRRVVMKTQLEVMRNVTFVAEQAIQLHGGMGVSDEVPISHAFRRLVVMQKLLGSRSSLLHTLANSDA